MDHEPKAKKLRLDEKSSTSQDSKTSQEITKSEEKNTDNSKACKEDLLDNKGNDITPIIQELADIFSFFVVLKANSEAEDDEDRLLRYNFGKRGVEYRYDRSKDRSYTGVEVWVKPPLREKKYKIGCFEENNTPNKRWVKSIAVNKAIRNLKKFCNYVEPNLEWFRPHETPDFIKNKTPCCEDPPTYKILTKEETGEITKEKAEYYKNFIRDSLLEDLYFIGDYSMQEKTNLINSTTVDGDRNVGDISWRHFGEEKKLGDRHFCIFKTKTATEIIKESIKLGGKHPKWLVTLNNSQFVDRFCTTDPKKK